MIVWRRAERAEAAPFSVKFFKSSFTRGFYQKGRTVRPARPSNTEFNAPSHKTTTTTITQRAEIHDAKRYDCYLG